MKPSRLELGGMMDVMHDAFEPQYGEAWNEQQVVSSLLIPETRYAIIDAAGIIGPPAPGVPVAGFYLTRKILDEEELLLIAISPQYRRKGLATQLLDHLFATARDRGTRSIFLEMRDDNPAQHLYVRHGFKQVGFRKDYYRGADGKLRNARTMTAPIT